MPDTAPPSKRFAIVFQRSPGQSGRVVAHGISEFEAREVLKIVAHDRGQVVAAPLLVTTVAGETWEAVPLESLRFSSPE